MNWIKNRVIEISIIFISILITLFVFEWFLIFENKSKPVERTFLEIKGTNYYFVKDPRLPSAFKKINNKNEIFIIGDSFAEGIVCAADKKNIPCYLDNMLPKKSRVLNLGIGGKNPAHYIDFLDDLKISTGDIAIIILYDNDIHLSTGNCEQIRRHSKEFDTFLPQSCREQDKSFIDKSNQSLAQKTNNIFKQYKIVELFKEIVFQIPMFSEKFYRSEYRNRWIDFEADENKWIISSLKTMEKIVKKKDGDIYFLYYPNTNNISKNDERHFQWLKFIQYANKEHNIVISDPYPYIISKAKSSSMVWSLTDKHPNCEAHKLMAEFIYQEIGKKLIS
ncbi:hypothetical protein N9T92_02745, partial [Candidatus Pelagibacter sp.]|nr:hypothetical protein [Candidatus Pelagibacter sp.]